MAPTIVEKFKHALHLDKKEHKEEAKKEEPAAAAPAEAAAPEAAAATETPKFKREDVTVVFVLGGPGAGNTNHLIYTRIWY